MLIKDSAQRARAAQPLQCGISPAVAERLQSRGIDPAQHASAIRAAHEFRARPRQARPIALSANPGGSVLDLSLDPSDVRVASTLNNAALLWRNDAFCADEICPVSLVDQRSDNYLLWGRDDQMTTPDDRIGPNGSAKEVAPTVSSNVYKVEDRALKGYTQLASDAENPTLRLRMMTVENVRQRLALGRELRVATLLLASGSYSGSNSVSLGATRKWNGGSAATPIADMLTALEAIPADVTHAVMSDVTWHAAQQNADLKAILASQLNNEGLLRPMDFGLYFGIPNLLIQKSFYKDATTGTVSRIWGSSGIVLARIDERPASLTLARTFRLRQGAGGFITSTWRDPDRGAQGAEYTRVGMSDDEVIVANDFGYLLDGVRQ